MDLLIKLYQKQDLQGIYNTINNDKYEMRFNINFSEESNKLYLNKLISLMQQQSVFCAVNVMRLPGETGLINTLRKKGYTITPGYSKYTSQILHVEANLKWLNYKYNSLGFSILFPKKPRKINEDKKSVSYFSIDSTIINMNFTCQAIHTEMTHDSVDDEYFYKIILRDVAKENGWRKVAEKDIKFKGIKCTDIEYNISDGINLRYKACSRGYFLYFFGIVANKPLLYSDKAEIFFDNINFSLTY